MLSAHSLSLETHSKGAQFINAIFEGKERCWLLTAPLLGLMLDLVVLLLADQELFPAATGRHMLNAHMDALPQNPVANLHCTCTFRQAAYGLWFAAIFTRYAPIS